MNISYNWLKEYVDFDMTPQEIATALTSIGLETGNVETVQTIKGGLEGLVVGEVLTCEPHPQLGPHACHDSEHRARRASADCMWRGQCRCRAKSRCRPDRHQAVRRRRMFSHQEIQAARG